MSQIDRNLRILVVDELTEKRISLQRMLETLGFKFVLVADGAIQAIPLLDEAQKFDLIISELNMSEMSGIDLLKHVRNRDRLSSIPFLMMTADATKDNVVAAGKAGVSDFLVKPFSVKQLELKIRRVVSFRNEAG